MECVMFGFGLLVCAGIFWAICVAMGYRKYANSIGENMERRHRLGLPPAPLLQLKNQQVVPGHKQQIEYFLQHDFEGRKLSQIMAMRERLWRNEEKVLQFYAMYSWASWHLYWSWLSECAAIELHEAEQGRRQAPEWAIHWSALYSALKKIQDKMAERSSEPDGPALAGECRVHTHP